MVIVSLCRAVAEQGLAVVAAEQEDEPVQVLAQLSGAVGRVADEGFQRGAEPVRVAGQPACQDPPYPGRSCETQRMPRSAAAANSGSGGAPVLGVPCCQKTASPVGPSPVPVS